MASPTPWDEPYSYKAISWGEPAVQPRDDEVIANLRRKRPAMETTIEVDRTDHDVHVIVTIGKNITTYKLNAELAKGLGEDLFKAGCNLEAEQGAKGA
jgi:hypothetical protein